MVSEKRLMSRYKPPSPQSSKYITPKGAQALREELEFLWRRKRPEITNAVAEGIDLKKKDSH